MKRDSFIFYRSFWEAVKELKPAEREKVMSCICSYIFDDNETELKATPKAIWTLIKPQLIANNKKYENGSKGGRPKKETEPKPNSNKNDDKTETEKKPKENLDETKDKPNSNPMKMKNEECRMKNENEECRMKMNNVLGFFEDEFKRPLSSIECQTISDWQDEYSDDLLKLALSEAVKNNARSLSYIDAILRNWKGAGITTAYEAQEQMEKHRKMKSKDRKLPDWYGNEDESYEQASDEEIAEFQRMLEEANHV